MPVDTIVSGTETPTQTTPAPETSAVPDAAALQERIAALEEQIAESNRTAEFWAEQARSLRTTPAQPGEPDDEPDDDEEEPDVLEAITTNGAKGFDRLAEKRG